MWQLINEEAGHFPSYDQKIQLKTETGTITNPQKVTETLDSYFVENVDRYTQHNNCHINTQIVQKKRDYCPNSILVLPINKKETECVITNRKGKFSAEYVAKQCARFIRHLLMHMYDISFKSGIFLGKFEIAKVKPL